MSYFPPPTHDSVKARMARAASPGFGYCGRCGLPWRFVDGHNTPYSESSACFPLCDPCWTILGDPDARMPYYRSLIFESWADPSRWPAIEAGVRAEGQAA